MRLDPQKDIWVKMPDRANETMRHDSQKHVCEARARYISYIGNETMRLDPQKDTWAKMPDRANGTMRHDSQKHVSEARARYICLLYTSPSPRDRQKSRMPSSA